MSISGGGHRVSRDETSGDLKIRYARRDFDPMTPVVDHSRIDEEQAAAIADQKAPAVQRPRSVAASPAGDAFEAENASRAAKIPAVHGVRIGHYILEDRPVHALVHARRKAHTRF